MGHGAFPDPPAFARAFRSAGVTGTNGKTTTTAWLAAALASGGAKVVRVTTVGTWLGDDKLATGDDYDGFVEAMRLAHEAGARLAALEMTSAALALGFAGAWPCDVGVFTNLTRDHLDAHGSAEHYLASKAQLFVHLREGGTAVLHAADPASALVAEVIPPGRRVLWYALESRAAPGIPELDLAARGVRVDEDGTSFELRGRGDLAAAAGPVRLRAHGEPHVENALAALAGACALGVEPAAAIRAIERAAPPPGRFQVLAREPLVVVDYAHSPDALARVLATARTLATARGGRVTVVFGAGGGADVGKRPMLGAAALAADRVVVTTDNPRHEDPAAIARAVVGGMGARGREAELRPDRATAIRRAVREAAPRDVVVIAGKGHEATQTARGEVRRFSDVECASRALAKR